MNFVFPRLLARVLDVSDLIWDWLGTMVARVHIQSIHVVFSFCFAIEKHSTPHTVILLQSFIECVDNMHS